MGVEGRAALVTGATSGIGAAIAQALAAAGARVAVAGRDAQRGEAVVAGIREAGGVAELVSHDAADPASAEAVAASATAAVGPIDILVNNAGTMFFGPFAEHPVGAFDTAVAVNLRGPFVLTQALIGGMAERCYGRVIFISSNGARSGAAMTSLYAMTKAGLEGLMRALMAEYAGHGITFNTVQPGLVDTPLTATMLAEPGMRSHFAGFHPGGRVGDPADIAHAVLLLADDAAGHFQANLVCVDGGLTSAIGYAVAAPPAGKQQ
jgi:2-hydroxycyclohexanecarboxyl-CoA dehydrogenase